MISENWMIAIVSLIVTIAFGLLCGMTGWMFKVHALLASMSESLKGIPELFHRTHEHSKKLSDHGARIKLLEERTCQEE